MGELLSPATQQPASPSLSSTAILPPKCGPVSTSTSVTASPHRTASALASNSCGGGQHSFGISTLSCHCVYDLERVCAFLHCYYDIDMNHLVLVSHTGRNKTVKILVSVWIQLTPVAQLLPEALGLHEDVVINPPLLPGGGPGPGLGVQVEGVVRGHFQTWVQASHSQIIVTRGVNIISQNLEFRTHSRKVHNRLVAVIIL